MKVGELRKGERALITGYNPGDPATRAKLLALGLIRGTAIRLVAVAPLGDPIAISVRGYNLSLRKNEADVLSIERLAKKDEDEEAEERRAQVDEELGAEGHDGKR